MTKSSRASNPAGWLLVADAAEQLGLTPGRIYHLISDGRVRRRYMSGLSYVWHADITAYARYRQQLHTLHKTLRAI